MKEFLSHEYVRMSHTYSGGSYAGWIPEWMAVIQSSTSDWLLDCAVDGGTMEHIRMIIITIDNLHWALCVKSAKEMCWLLSM